MVFTQEGLERADPSFIKDPIMISSIIVTDGRTDGLDKGIKSIWLVN